MWNHNIHFHDYLLHRLPDGRSHSLEIGCGLGLFTSKLAKRYAFVSAIDVDREILKEASIQHPASNIAYQCTDFLEADFSKDSYDVIVAIASLHHMDLEAALKKIKTLLRPSGKLLILGLYRESTALDYLYSAVSIPLNHLYLSWHRERNAAPKKLAPTRPAQLSLKQIKTVADDILPGSTLQRHLFWRYSLIWQKL